MFCCVRNLLRTIAVVTCFVGGATCVYPVYAANSDAPTLVIRHAKVFDGRSLTLLPDHAILISGNRIVSVLPDPGVATTTWQSAHIIDANGRVVTPGLIDAHVHTTVVVGIPRLRDSDPGYLAARSGAEAHAMLMRGFTTIRDMAGPAFGLQQAIDEGVLEGPRIFPSGAMIGQTSGHADLRQRGDTPSRRWTGRLDALEERGYVLIADGPDEVQAGVREQLRLGATQIKVAAGGGVSSAYDPIDSVQYSPAELLAAVQSAEDFGTYVAVHAYTSESTTRAVLAGARSVEHAQLIDEPTMRLIAERGVFLSPQAHLFSDDSPAAAQQTAAQRAKASVVSAGLDRMMLLARKYKVKVAFGTDLFGAPQMFGAESREFGARLRWFSSGEVLQQATSINGDLLAMSGTRNPYGRLGVLEDGALADLLILDGNPLEDIRILEMPDQAIRVIVKDGRVVKNGL